MYGTPERDNQSPNREEQLSLAIRTAKANNKDSARLMFMQILDEDRKNERALMWMAKLAETKAERKKWLARVLEFHPNNEAARAAMNKSEYRSSARDNRTLLIFGVIAGIMIVLAVVLFIGLFVLPGMNG